MPICSGELNFRAGGGSRLVAGSDLFEFGLTQSTRVDLFFLFGLSPLRPAREPHLILADLAGERLCCLCLPLNKLGSSSDELGVVAIHTQHPARIRVGKLDDPGGNEFEETPIVGDKHGGIRSLSADAGGKELLEPGDPFKIKVVRWFIEKHQIRFVGARGERTGAR